MKPSEALDKAVEIIERDGWIQGAYYLEPPIDLPVGGYEAAVEEARREAPCCQRGAVIRTLAGTWKSVSMLPRGDLHTLERTYVFCRQVTGCHPIEWNDAPGRTKEEVVDMLKSAAGLAREAGE